MYEKIYSISEVSEITGIKSPTLRNWEEEFKDFLKVSRDKHGSRIYTKSDIDRLLGIQMMRKKGLTLIAIRNSLEHLQNDVSSNLEVASTSELATSSLAMSKQDFSNEIKKIVQETIREELEKLFQKQSLEISEVLETRLEKYRKKKWWKFWE